MELWHYTSFSSCEKILQNKELWLSRFTDTNDATDCTWAKRVIIDYIQPRMMPKFKEFFKEPIKRVKRAGTHDIDTWIKHEITQSLEVPFDSYLRKEGSFDGYMFCFSEKDQTNSEDGILSMWRGYGGKKPVALVFNREKLHHILTKKYPDFRWLLGEVEYAKDGSTLSDSLKKHILFIEEILPQMTNAPKSLSEEEMTKLFQAIKPLSVTIKHSGFYEEKEIRLFTDCPNADYLKLAPELRAMTGKITLKPDDRGKKRLVIKLEEKLYDCLEKIVLGPGIQKVDKKRISSLIPRNLKLAESEIPFLHKDLA